MAVWHHSLVDTPISFTVRTPLPGRRVTIIACAFCASELAVGSYFGFALLSAHVLFWVLGGLLVLPAFIVANEVFPSAGSAETSIRTGVVAFALVVLCGLVLGATHLLTRTAHVAAEAAVLFLTVLAWPRRTPLTRDTRSSLPVPVLGLWIAIIAFVIGTGVSHSPFIAYDSLSYHLFFPARWLQDHRLSIIPTPFSDAAQAYQPGNGELWFLWLMVPFHGDVLARIGQLPFYLLCGTTLYALARGATPVHAIYAPTFFLITPTVVEQAVGANVDLINATGPISNSGDIDAPRPRFERMHGTREAWLGNLKARGIGYLFISALGPYEIDHVWHNAHGCPIEDEWATADPVAFRLAYENPDARIYEVRLP